MAQVVIQRMTSRSEDERIDRLKAMAVAYEPAAR